MRIIVYKGTSEIGGTCIELSHDGNTILLDLGMPLKESSKPVDLNSFSPDAVFVSHSHQDHYGLIEDLDESIPVYMNKLSRNLIDATRLFTHRQPLKNNIRFFKPWEPLA